MEGVEGLDLERGCTQLHRWEGMLPSCQVFVKLFDHSSSIIVSVRRDSMAKRCLQAEHYVDAGDQA